MNIFLEKERWFHQHRHQVASSADDEGRQGKLPTEGNFRYRDPLRSLRLSTAGVTTHQPTTEQLADYFLSHCINHNLIKTRRLIYKTSHSFKTETKRFTRETQQTRVPLVPGRLLCSISIYINPTSFDILTEFVELVGVTACSFESIFDSGYWELYKKTFVPCLWQSQIILENKIFSSLAQTMNQIRTYVTQNRNY